MIDFVDLETAKAATGIRLVVAGSVPSSWSEAVKNLLHVGQLPAVVVRNDTPEVNAWTGADNVPALFHGREPVRTGWAAIVALIARLVPSTLPADVRARATAMGALEVVAGEDGLGWSARLVMIHEGLVTDGKRGFSARVSGYLAKRYGYDATTVASSRARIPEQLAYLRHLLGGADYFGGAAPNALDVYVASFLTMFTPLSEADCPRFAPHFRPAFATAAEELSELVPAELVALRARMFERHLPFPIQL